MPRGDDRAAEDAFEWDTDAYVGRVADDGTVLEHDVQSVTFECPRCERRSAVY